MEAVAGRIAPASSLGGPAAVNDRINSVVAKWLGLAKPSDSGRLATRGLAHYPDGGHGFEPKILQLVGQGFRVGVMPTSATDVYWFFTWSSSPDCKDSAVDRSPAVMKQFVLTTTRGVKVSPQVLEAVERSKMREPPGYPGSSREWLGLGAAPARLEFALEVHDFGTEKSLSIYSDNDGEFGLWPDHLFSRLIQWLKKEKGKNTTPA